MTDPFQTRFQALLRGGALVSEARRQALEETQTREAKWALCDRYVANDQPLEPRSAFMLRTR